VGLLHELGYTNVRHYHGGMAEWTATGGSIELTTPSPSNGKGGPAISPGREARAANRSRSQQWGNAILDAIESRSTAQLFLFWLAMILACAVVYWLGGLSHRHGLISGGTPVPFTPAGLAVSIYFSFVTATSLGYGDVLPMGALRIVAIMEAVAGLLVFGAVVSKFVSRRQDQLVREIHRVTFEQRLARVQTDLHLVLSELQAISAMCAEGNAQAERVAVRLESAAMVFAAQLRAVHDLLYRPQWTPEEAVLEAILASLAAALRELADVLACLPAGFRRSPMLDGACRRMARLAEEICGECVPRAFAPALTIWMDRVQATARRLVPPL